MNLGNAVGEDCGVPCDAASINPFYTAMGFDYELQVAFAAILAVVVLHRPFDIDGVRVVPLDEIGVVAVHRPHQVGERAENGGRQAAAEAGGLLGQVESKAVSSAR